MDRIAVAKKLLIYFEFLVLFTSVPGQPIRKTDFEDVHLWYCRNDKVIDASGYPAMLGDDNNPPGSCVDYDPPITTADCNNNPPDIDNSDDKYLWNSGGKVAVYYRCDGSRKTSTGEVGLFTYCIKGEWTDINDRCFNECQEPRECYYADTSEQNDYQDMNICPLRYGPSVNARCDMRSGRRLTRVLRLENGDDDFDLSKATAQTEQGALNDDYFIGLKNLIALHWELNGTTPIPHDMYIEKRNDQARDERAAYNNVLFDHSGTLISLGQHTGSLGDMLRGLEGNEFCPDDTDECWWGIYNEMKEYITSTSGEGGAIAVWIRPHKEGNKLILCPENFRLSTDGYSCLKNVVSNGGIVESAQACTKENATLAFITDFRDISLNNQKYMTGFYVKSRNPYTYIPPIEDNTLVKDDTNVTEHWSSLHSCVVMERTGVDQWIVQFCHSYTSRAICMWPVLCPATYQRVGNLCYKFNTSPSTETTFLDALATCNKEGSGLAHPTTLSQIDALAQFIVENVDWNTEDIVNVSIGLNVAFGNATLGGLYSISEDVHEAVISSSVEATEHLFLSVFQNASWLLTPTDFDSLTPFFVCEFHGPLGCWESVPDTAHSLREQVFGNRTIHETLTFTCNRGFFVDAEVGNKEKQYQYCHGQLGGWAPREPLRPCIGVVVCDDLPGKPHMTRHNSSYPGYDTYWIMYECYSGMGTVNGTLKQQFTCTEYNGNYSYDGDEVVDCDRCMREPNADIPNSIFEDSDDEPWMVDTMKTVVCDDGYMLDTKLNDQQVLCTLKGWVGMKCKKVCLGEPLVDNAVTTWKDDMWLVGTNVTATCLQGYHFIDADTTEMQLYCKDSGWQDLPSCEKVCQDDLEVANATVTRKGKVWVVGTNNTVTCFEEHLFVSINSSTMKVGCTFEGWAETEGCVKVCGDEPNVIGGTTDWYPVVPRVEGSTLDATCIPGLYLYPSLDTQQTLNCTYEGWTNATICEQVCFQTPDLVEEKALWDDSTGPGRLEDTVSVKCRSNHYNNETLNGTTITVVCKPQGWMAIDSCILSCREPPEFDVDMVWEEREPGRPGDEVTMDCPTDHRNSDDVSSTTIIVACTSDGWVTVNTCQKTCSEDPDTASANVVWSSGLVSILMGTVTVDCLNDHYNEDDLVTNTTVVTCTGDGWMIRHSCVRVCAETPDFGDAPMDWGTRGLGKEGQDVSLLCPEGYRNNNSLASSTTTVTCTMNGWVNLDECVKACAKDPDTASTNIHWEAGRVSLLGTEIEVNCLDDHYRNETLVNNITTVRCVEEGWWVTHPCVRICTESPDFGNVSVTWEEREPGRVGDEMSLDCPFGYRSSYNLDLNNTLINCTDNGWMNVDPCIKVCLAEDLGGVASEEEEEGIGVWRVDDEVRRGCPDDLLTYEEALNITAFVCTPDGWENPDRCVNVCRERMYPVNGVANWNQRIWTEGHKLTVVCLSQHQVAPDVHSYVIPCTDSGWFDVNSTCSYCEYSSVFSVQ